MFWGPGIGACTLTAGGMFGIAMLGMGLTDIGTWPAATIATPPETPVATCAGPIGGTEPAITPAAAGAALEGATGAAPPATIAAAVAGADADALAERAVA